MKILSLLRVPALCCGGYIPTHRQALLSAVLVLAASALPLSSIAATPEPVATVTGGRVQGTTLPTPGGAVFKSIPFAAPPVGANRWREPQVVKPWAGARPAKDYGAPCAQSDSGWNGQIAAISSEDCLYLNVWTPEWPVRAKRPVMVWVHGGGNGGGSALGGASIEPPFDGASLARRGVVVVTINYRLGILGFLGHSELAAESPHRASGNYGLLDQLAALRWVQANIAKFGGDPANVTLFGQSAGAQDSAILSASPLSKGLFRKVILESGTAMIDDKRLLSRSQVEQVGSALAQVLNAPATGAVAFMRGLPVSQLLAANQPLRQALMPLRLMVEASADGYVVPQGGLAAYQAGAGTPRPMIIGSNSLESPGFRLRATEPDAIRTELRERVSNFYAAHPDLQQRALAAYGLADGAAATGDPMGIGRLWAVDRGFRCQNATLAGWHSAIAPTYQYEFTAGSPTHPPAHSAELDFTFGYLRDQASDPALVRLSDQMQAYWTNFAKTGNPNGAGLPRWPQYSVATRSYVRFGNDGVTDQTNLRGATCDLYREKLERGFRSGPG